MRKLVMALIAISLLTGCSNEEIVSETTINQSLVLEQRDQLDPPIAMDDSRVASEMKQMEENNNSRLAAIQGDRGACRNFILVPFQYATIQEAVDNVCPNGSIIVRSGTYNEIVYVNKPGIKFTAMGNVTLNGGFNLNEDADNASISNFTIVNDGTFYGINGLSVDGVKILNNTLTGINLTGIRFFNANNTLVHGNQVSGFSWGIFFGSSGNDGASNNNIISSNHVTGIAYASVVGLQGNCDNNKIINNQLVDNPNISNAGIMLYSFTDEVNDSKCDNNTIFRNTSSENSVGLWVFNDGENNRVGPDNTLNENRSYGFYIDGMAANNYIYNNTMQDNLPCDIGNYAIDIEANTFYNNTAGCIEEL
jgi:parallel beta-helix repeat protein